MTDTQTESSIGRELRQLAMIEHSWLMRSKVPSTSHVLGWMPFQLADFAGMMVDVAQEAKGNRFLDVGCGPGTKVAMARLLFGFDSSGIEIDTQMALEAAFLLTEGEVYNGDALYWDDGFYGQFDVLWLYRPFRAADLQERLEKRIRSEMKSGAILAGGAWETPCPSDWLTVVDDWEIKRGAWMKP